MDNSYTHLYDNIYTHLYDNIYSHLYDNIYTHLYDNIYTHLYDNIYAHLYVYDTNIITYLSVKCCTYLDFHINNSLFKYEVLSLLDKPNCMKI